MGFEPLFPPPTHPSAGVNPSGRVALVVQCLSQALYSKVGLELLVLLLPPHPANLLFLYDSLNDTEGSLDLLVALFFCWLDDIPSSMPS